MKRLTLYTHRYELALRDFAAGAADNGLITVRRAGWRGNNRVFCVCCLWDALQPDFTDGLMVLLEEIAMQENPVYRQSPKLRDLGSDLRHTPVHSQGVKSLDQFLKLNRGLHLEGYVTFRMSEYCETLDMMTYSLIKKLKLT